MLYSHTAPIETQKYTSYQNIETLVAMLINIQGNPLTIRIARPEPLVINIPVQHIDSRFDSAKLECMHD